MPFSRQFTEDYQWFIPPAQCANLSSEQIRLTPIKTSEPAGKS